MVDFGSSQILVGSGLEPAGANLNAQAATIMGELETLRSTLSPLADTWVAQASTYYQDAMLQWDTAAIGLFGDQGEGGVLGTIANAMNVNWGNYTDAEEANIKTWQSAG